MDKKEAAVKFVEAQIEAALAEGGPIAQSAARLKEEIKAEAEQELSRKINEALAKHEADEQERRRKETEELRRNGATPFGTFGIRIGESPNTSRAFSLMRLCQALNLKRQNESDWNAYAKLELDVSQRLRQAYHERCGGLPADARFVIPLGTELLPAEDGGGIEVEGPKGTKRLPGIPHDLLMELRSVMGGTAYHDPDEVNWLARRGLGFVRKDLSSVLDTSGGVLVGLPAQGELIEQLRKLTLFDRAGPTEITLPAQGSIRFPRQTTGVTVSAYSEGGTITESTPMFGELTLTAKKYSGLVDIPEELFKFATSVSVEAWLRMQFLLDIGVKIDTDLFFNADPRGIKGLLTYSGRRSVAAGTAGANGDTLDPPDPVKLQSDIADQSVPLMDTFFFGLTNTLWGGLSTRRDTQNSFVFAVGVNMLGGPAATPTLAGSRVILSSNVPTNRSKGASSSLTLLFGGVAAHLIMARAGVVDIKVTDSDASKFQQGISTMRGTMWLDAGPRHEAAFGMIDQLLNS